MTEGDGHKETNMALSSSPEEEIRLRAYEIYLRRGEAPGHEVEDWLQAERELMGDQFKKADSTIRR